MRSSAWLARTTRWPGRRLAPGPAVPGSKVKLTFEATPASGQKVPEWRVIS
jgi:hypothetical protein